MNLYFWHAAEHAARAVSDAPPATLGLTSNLQASGVYIPESLAKSEVLPTVYVPFRWTTPWGAPNATDADPLWENINTAHGHIAVPHTWAAQNNVGSFLLLRE